MSTRTFLRTTFLLSQVSVSPDIFVDQIFADQDYFVDQFLLAEPNIFVWIRWVFFMRKTLWTSFLSTFVDNFCVDQPFCGSVFMLKHTYLCITFDVARIFLWTFLTTHKLCGSDFCRQRLFFLQPFLWTSFL